MSPGRAFGARQAPAQLLAALIAAASLVGPVAAAAAAPSPAEGLVVRLKDAAANGSGLAGNDVWIHRDAPRWRRVLGAAALTGASGQREPALRAVGRDQLWLDFGRTLAADEADRIADRLRSRPEIDWVAPNRREQRLQVPSDPLLSQQWWLKPAGGSNQNAIADRLRGVPGFITAWQSGIAGSRGGPAAVVAVLDTGVTAHPDIAGRLLPGHDFVSDPVFANDGDGRDADPSDPGDWVSAADRADPHYQGCAEQDSTWHGTIIAGLVAAIPDNGQGVAGANLDGRVLPVRVAGKCGASVVDIIDALRWAAGLQVAGVPMNPNPARIINVSFGGTAACGREYQDAIDEVRVVKGAVVVAAAGNDHGVPSRPASCDGVVGVVALNRDGFKSHYSNFGPALAATGVATVGGDDSRAGTWAGLLADTGIVTAWNDGRRGPGGAGYAALFGTSFAAPLVSATMSLMLSVNPALTQRQLIDGIRLSARPHVTSTLIGACSDSNPGRCLCSTATCGAGILDAAQALVYATAPGSYVAPPRQAAVIDTPEVVQATAIGLDLPANAVVVVSSQSVSQGVGVAGGGGGGATAPAAVLGLLLAALALLRCRRIGVAGA